MRKANLLTLIGNPDERGAVARFAKKYNLNPAQISLILKGKRNIGEKLARNFEKSIGLAPLALDRPLDEDTLLEVAKYEASRLGEEAVKLVNLVAQLPQNTRKMAIGVIQAMIAEENQDAPREK